MQELSNEIGDRQSQISGVEDDLNQVLMTFPGDELPVVTELGHQVTQCHVCLSELMEKLELVRQLSEVDSTDNNNMDCLPSPLLEDVSVIVSLCISVHVLCLCVCNRVSVYVCVSKCMYL